MMNISIMVANKIATVVGSPVIVCGNSDYTVTFTTDAEWDEYTARTARFTYIVGGRMQYTDVPFTGDVCDAPIFKNVNGVHIGLYAGDLHTTTGAVVKCKKSILCGSAVHEPPADDVYNQLMAMIVQMGTVDEELSATSINPVENRAVYAALAGVSIMGTIPEVENPQVWALEYGIYNVAGNFQYEPLSMMGLSSGGNNYLFVYSSATTLAAGTEEKAFILFANSNIYQGKTTKVGNVITGVCAYGRLTDGAITAQSTKHQIPTTKDVYDAIQAACVVDSEATV